jgi:hypothetical protein
VIRPVTVGLALLGLAAAGSAGASEQRVPELDRLKALAGEWQGTARGAEAAKAMPTRATVKVVSGGSVVMLVTDPGTPHEMVTMFHPDDGTLLATHYCAAMNQPRLRAQAGQTGDQLTFEFVDGTNLDAHPGRMQRLVVTFDGADRDRQEWTYAEGDRTSTMVFELSRKKKPHGRT